MRPPTDQERQLLAMISAAGGSACPGEETIRRISPQGRKSLGWLVKNGYLTDEPTDDGPRYHLTALGQEGVDRG